MKRTIQFKLFGEVCVRTDDQQWKPVISYSKASMGKKQQAFFAYLLLNHNNKLASTELMEHFWPDDSKDPANSLKNMMHKIRTLLRAMFPDMGDLILTCPGGYEWNQDVDIQVDTDLFETLYHESKTTHMAEGFLMEQKAFELYEGDILPGVSLEWLVHRNTYFQSIFIDICKSLVVQMMENELWNDVLRICDRAYQLAPEIEEFTISAMQALINLGMPNQAIKHYEDYCSMLWDGFSLPPSGAVEQVHSMAVHAVCSTDDNLEKIVNQINMIVPHRKAFQCSQMVFLNIIQLELRNMLRNRHESSLAVLQLKTSDSAVSSSTDIRRAERTLLQGLRSGDPFTRLNQGAFILLLSGASEENAHKVMQRLENSFYSTYPRSSAVLTHKIYPLNPSQGDMDYSGV